MSFDTTRRIEYMPLKELEENPANPKKHSLDTLETSVNRFGYIDPIVMDERTGYIISGHGRYTALTQMETQYIAAPGTIDVPEGVKLSEEGSWLVPVARGWGSSDDLEASASLIALNRVNELGGWDEEALLDLLEDLAEPGNDPVEALAGVGYTEQQYTDLQRTLGRYELDLDELAQMWDGESGLKPKEAEGTDKDYSSGDDAGDSSFDLRITIKPDTELLARWEKWEVQWNSPSQALSELLTRVGF